MSIYKNEIGDHLGDMLLFVSAGLIMSERSGQQLTLSLRYSRNEMLTSTMGEEIAAILETTGSVAFVRGEGDDSFGNLWKGGVVGNGLQLKPTRLRWKGRQGRFVGYQFDGRSSPAKNPPEREIPDIIDACHGLLPLRLGHPMTIAQSLAMLVECDFFVGCDSGIAMLAIAAGVPTYIIQYGMPIDHWKIGLTFLKCIKTAGFKAAMAFWPELPPEDKRDLYARRPAEDPAEMLRMIQFHPAGMKENLIYYCVRGAEWRDMLVMSVRSLRTVGKYRGRIVVVCPDICPMLRRIEDQVEFVVVAMTSDRRMDNCYAIEFIQPMLYHKILYLDCDIMATREIEDAFKEADVLAYFEEPWQKLADQYANPIYTAYFSKEEMPRVRNFKCINSGQFGGNASQIVNLFHVWKRLYESKKDHDFHGAEQSSFNTILRRQQLRGKPWSRLIVCNAGMTAEADWSKHCLTHFAGYEGRVARMCQLAEAQALVQPVFDPAGTVPA